MKPTGLNSPEKLPVELRKKTEKRLGLQPVGQHLLCAKSVFTVRSRIELTVGDHFASPPKDGFASIFHFPFANPFRQTKRTRRAVREDYVAVVAASL